MLTPHWYLGRHGWMGLGLWVFTAIVEDHEGEIHLVANGNSLIKLVPRQ